jgi:hypothetical protein
MEQHAALIRFLLDLADEARARLPGLTTAAASSMQPKDHKSGSTEIAIDNR